MTQRTCTIEGCDKPHECRDLCINHYIQARRKGLPLLDKQDPHEISSPDADRKLGTCRTCGPDVEIVRPVSKWLCRTEHRRKKREYHNANREHLNAYYARYSRARSHGVGIDDIEAIISAAGFRCEICHAELSMSTARIDHDHACCERATSASPACGNCIRGVLCQGCNAGLGLLRDNPEILRAAIDYLATHKVA